MHRLRYAALGAALAYFFDPENGRERRKTVIKRLTSLRSGGEPELVDDLVERTQESQPVPGEPAQASQ